MRYTTRISGLLGVSLALAACEITGPLPEGAEPMTPLPHYGDWWKAVEQCSGLSRPMRDVDWFVVPGSAFRTSVGVVEGVYRNGKDQIVLAGRTVKDGQLVRHEMLHALIDGRFSRALHPAEFFLRRCAGIVMCASNCVESSDWEAVPGDVPLVSGTTLEVSIETDTVISARNYEGLGYTSILVKARNPAETDVNVRIHGSRFAIGFALQVDGPTPAFSRRLDDLVDRPGAAYFRAGETKSYLFDLYMPQDRNGAVGIWTAGGGFADGWVRVPTTFRVTP